MSYAAQLPGFAGWSKRFALAPNSLECDFLWQNSFTPDSV